MINRNPSTLLKRVGFTEFDTLGLTDETTRPPKPLKQQSITDLIESLRKYVGISKYYVYPNYQFSWFGCSGFVADIESTSKYSNDLFVSWLYRCNFMCEVYVGDEKNFMQSLPKKMSMVKLAIPDDPAVAMNEESTVESGWSPALGRYGNLIYIGSVRERDNDKDVIRNRYFICGRSGIHDDLVNALLDRDYNNRTANAKPDSSVNDSQSSTTVARQFEEGGLMDRAIDLAKENCRRLVYAFARVLGVFPSENISEITHYNSDETPIYYDIPSKTQTNLRDMKLLKEALALWPKEATVFPYSVLKIEGNTKLNGYEIGAVLLNSYLMFSNTSELDKFQNIISEHGVKFEPSIKSYNSLQIESMYNSHELLSGSNMRWYSNCTPIDNVNGLLVQRTIKTGFVCINSPIFNSKPDLNWKNEFGSAYPAVFPFKEGGATATQDGVIIFDSKGSSPSQLNGSFPLSDSLENSQIQRQLGDGTDKFSQGTHIDPLFVYLSPQIEKFVSF